VPTLPVSCEIPELVIAPTVEKRTKSAAVPNGGACAKFKAGIEIRTMAVNTFSSCVFIIYNSNCE
jgi:hypothetical protein